MPRLQALRQDFKKNLEKGGEIPAEDKFERNLKLFQYHLVNSDKEFGLFLKKLKKRKEFALDTETANFDPVSAELLGVSFSWKAGEAHYINFQFSIFNFQLKDAD